VGSDLPSWLSIDPSTGVITATPGEDDLGHYAFRVAVSDGSVTVESEAMEIGVFIPLADVRQAVVDTENLGVTIPHTLISDTPVESVLSKANDYRVIQDSNGDWHILQFYMENYGGFNEVISINTGTGNIVHHKLDEHIQNMHSPTSLIHDGKLYFAQWKYGNSITINVYDPDTQTFSFNPYTIPDTIAGEYKPMSLNMDGNIYLGGIWEPTWGGATAVSLNPSTGIVTDYGQFDDNSAFVNFIAADTTHVYAGTGNPARVVARNKTTGAESILATSNSTSYGACRVYPATNGAIGYTKQSDGTVEYFYLYNGQKYGSYTSESEMQLATAPWGGTGYTEVAQNPSMNYPEIDNTAAILGSKSNTMWFRPYERIGDTGATAEEAGWQSFNYNVDVYPIDIRKFIALENGNIFGTGKDYSGWFMSDGVTSNFLGRAHISPYAIVEHSNGNIYFSGYPSGTTWEYNPAQPWTQKNADVYTPLSPMPNFDDQSLNPRFIGYTKTYTGTSKNHVAIEAQNGLVYIVGERERLEGEGGTLSWYNPVTGEMDGIWEIFSNYKTEIMTSTHDGRYLIISGDPVTDTILGKPKPTVARFFVFDTKNNTIINTIDQDFSTPASIVGVGNYVYGHITGPDNSTWTEHRIFKMDPLIGTKVWEKSFQAQGYSSISYDGLLWFTLGKNILVKMTLEGNLEIMDMVDGGLDLIHNNVIYVGDKTLKSISMKEFIRRE
jgi:hypothetical protein